MLGGKYAGGRARKGCGLAPPADGSAATPRGEAAPPCGRPGPERESALPSAFENPAFPRYLISEQPALAQPDASFRRFPTRQPVLGTVMNRDLAALNGETPGMTERQTRYEYEELLACGRGELFGAGNAQLPLPPMLMFDRISEISETGGEGGKGHVRAELNVRPDLWFFACHFKGDPVMPGLPRPRRAVAAARLLPWLARRPGPRPRAFGG